MKIAVLETGVPPDPLIEEFGSYPDMFADLLGSAYELETFDVHCITHPVEEDRCSASHNCSIRPVWMMLQRRIDDVLSGVSIADLLEDEATVRERVGLPILETV